MRLFVKKVLTKVNSLCVKRLASTYEGDGKTIAQVINKDLGTLMVSAVSTVGFRLNSGLRIIGPAIIFPRTILNWNITGVEDVSADSLSLFSLMSPKVDIIVFGYGDAKTLPKDVRHRVVDFGNRHKIGLEILPTENAIATFNFLNHEKRFVVGAFIPPKKVEIYDDSDIISINATNQKLLAE